MKYFNTDPKWTRFLPARWQPQLPSYLPRLLYAEHLLPRFVKECLVTKPIINELELLDWECLPAATYRNWFGQDPIPLSAFIGSYLVKLNQSLPTMGALRRFLVQHPALIWALGFPLIKGGNKGNYGFDPQRSVPSQRHLSRKLSQIPNTTLQLLLNSQVSQLQKWLPANFGETISLDTKHIIAWVKENNPKQFIKEGRFDKTEQPKGDPDCKLGCKRRRNQTPTKEGQPATNVSVGVGEFYWGYASGAVVTKVPIWGEFVLAELTQTFENADVSYFLPLMAQVEQRLSFKPPYGTLDAAFDAFYIYDYFHNKNSDGFAAVPLRKMKTQRQFDKTGLPLCEAGLPMPLKRTFMNRTSLVHHERGRYACPLLFPEANGKTCPIDYSKWTKGGCLTTLPSADGARIRYQLDRESEKYKRIYAQRTAVERIFSQAVNLNMERPKLRNQKAITNQNTLTYILINLRAMHKVLARLNNRTH